MSSASAPESWPWLWLHPAQHPPTPPPAGAMAQWTETVQLLLSGQINSGPLFISVETTSPSLWSQVKSLVLVMREALRLPGPASSAGRPLHPGVWVGSSLGWDPEAKTSEPSPALGCREQRTRALRARERVLGPLVVSGELRTRRGNVQLGEHGWCWTLAGGRVRQGWQVTWCFTPRFPHPGNGWRLI